MIRVKTNDNARLLRLFFSLICLALGILLICYAKSVLKVCCFIISAGLAVYGIVRTVQFCFFRNKEKIFDFNLLKCIIGITGAVIFALMPGFVITVLPVIFGLLLCAIGIYNIQAGVVFRELRMRRATVGIVYGILILVCGIVCLVFSSHVSEWILRFTGICLTLNALSDIFELIFVKTIFKKSHRVKDVNEPSVVVEKVEDAK